ncbi:aminopeptidase [Coprinopsis cinerea okayama7|uniref:Peptide hydrolase n=1 Tax=Coprinopsis cinerea (strain Okayama-7 / 130 / ATCC MYA-4618 / FGSC 9003) TaxID=240176 RepID=A8NYE0_COPC7|nr:aminopeptidase [Coprinopsis cinerea okayama7\|eukprot:XP_001837404.2 aminopeptidase [Coprinopsis cinerea okayama7\
MASTLLSLWLILPLNSTLFSQEPCLTHSFYGNYKLQDSTVALFQASTPDCVEYSRSYLSQEPNVLLEIHRNASLVWLEKEHVDPSLLQQESFMSDDFYRTLTRLVGEDQPLYEQEDQHTFNAKTDNGFPYTLFSSNDATMLALPRHAALQVDTILPRFVKSTLVPDAPFTYREVSNDDLKVVRDVLGTLRFNPDIASVVNNISIPQIQQDIRFLTGEDGKSGIVSRHSFSSGARTAAAWIKARIEETGATCRLSTFLTGFAPNVICRYSAIKKTDDTVIISGHYDSRGSFGSVRAPGADDDGSGTTGVLSIARTIGRKRLRFHKNVELVAFAGEEQGLYGSRAYARELRAQNASIVMMIQADMTAYRAAQEPLQLGLPERIGTPEVTQLVANVSAFYSPELTVGYSGVCSI